MLLSVGPSVNQNDVSSMMRQKLPTISEKVVVNILLSFQTRDDIFTLMQLLGVEKLVEAESEQYRKKTKEDNQKEFEDIT